MPKRRIVAVAVLTAATLMATTGCASLFGQPEPRPKPSASPSATATSPSGETDFEKTAAETLVFAQTLIGMKEKDAKAAITAKGYTYRIVERDGEHFIVTMDYSPTRINLSITKGIITDVSVG